ncbi:Hypothetical protein ACA1_230260 [Acanthamoeba castellanii str. Neff]|uniref:Phosphatidylinositol transfer protein N-terminal domain-containing protein n=1 Tax=Acanthamoeba castellanii (strain ATCC 30010 / Neff) TaxID=1257118 RepID=L8HB97_ACACF|nr:Hypothetical protein ACA1_230260 [Acanthamoeba castellanii str. Neff]ELR21651.1 Hypothetical protein ACA1_230260 [Acanthamoeba castellanii str. Neff]
MVLAKEYRIPLPFTVDEFRVGHVYMVVRTGREGRSTGTEVVTREARPYEDKKQGTRGVYRVREFHVEGLPPWTRKLLPHNALTIEEKTWDAYPYIKTVYTCPLLGSRITVTACTKFIDDAGTSSRAHGKESEAAEVDYINIAKEQVKGAAGKNYIPTMHPASFSSSKTKRGPLKGAWEKSKPIMCAYKLVSVSFNYPRWTFPGRVERYIHQVLREIYLASHQLAFCSMDDWIDLSYQDVRELELASLSPASPDATPSSATTPPSPPPPPTIDTVDDDNDNGAAPADEPAAAAGSVSAAAGPNSWSAHADDLPRRSTSSSIIAGRRKQYPATKARL